MIDLLQPAQMDAGQNGAGYRAEPAARDGLARGVVQLLTSRLGDKSYDLARSPRLLSGEPGLQGDALAREQIAR